MNTRSKLKMGLIISLIVILSCNFPGWSEPLPLSPNIPLELTLTAIFSPGDTTTNTPIGVTSTIPSPEDEATSTSTSTEIVLATTQVVLPSATITPSFTLVPSTLTPSRTATRINTIIPSTATRTTTRTFTQTPTRTPARTVTNTTNLTRSGLHHKAKYMSSPPTLDGSWDEWDADTYDVSSVVYGAGEWKGADDLSASVRFGWDENNFYIAVKVWDDFYAQNTSGYDIYLGDSLEINFDADLLGDFFFQERNSDDYQLGISPGSGSIDGPKEAYLWFPREKRGSRSQVQIASVSRDDGYRVEAAIPWNVFGVSPKENARYGFTFAVSDNDNKNENIQQTMISSVPGRKLLNPTTWGELRLVK